MKMTMSCGYLKANLDILSKLGLPREDALSAMGLSEDDLLDPNNRLDLDLFLRCLKASAEQLSNPQIGVELGLLFRVAGFGHTGAIYSFCDTLKDVIEMNNIYQKVAIDAGRVAYVQSPMGTHHMCFRPHYSDWHHYKMITDVIMASYVTTYRWLSWVSGEDVVSTSLPYIEPNQLEKYEARLQTPIDTSRQTIGIEISEAAMSQKLTTRDPERLAKIRLSLDKIIGEQTSLADFNKGVDAAIQSAIESGNVSAQTVASRMGLGLAVFRSRLMESGDGMRPRIDRVRKALFEEKIKEGSSFSQIAQELGYNDQAAMNRAFWRWFDMTPSQWRSQNLDLEREI